MSKHPLHFETLSTLSAKLASGAISAVELTEHYLARIEALDPTLNAFRLVCAEQALAAARAAQLAIDSGRRLSPLHGIPFAAKDLFDVAGLPTSAGCRLLETNIKQRDAHAVAQLCQAGMVLVGKTNTVQFAYGGTGINHHHGTPHNPWSATHHVPGGSSSGSGVAVAAGLVPAALGSDTGGSVRIPAALCGTTGLKTTVGRISRAGVYPLSWSLDSVGPLTRDVADAALLYQVMAGPDARDPSTAGSAPVEVLDTIAVGIKGLRVAIAETVFWDDADREVVAATRATVDVFKSLGATVSSVEFPEADLARQLNPRGLVIAAEAYTLNKTLLDDHFAELDPIVSHRMIKGKEILAHEYLATTREWEQLQLRSNARLRDVDILLCPTCMLPARPLSLVDADNDSYARHNLDYLRNTAIGNILNLCGLSVPCGLTRAGLPIGLMLYAKPFDEQTLLRAGYAFQQATDWHQQTPSLDWIG